MKKIVFSLSVLLTCSFKTVNAQGIMIDSISAKTNPEIKAVNGGERYYAYYFKQIPDDADSAVFVISFYEQSMRQTGSAEIKLPKTAELAACASNGQFVLCIFNDPVKKTRTTLSVTEMGNILNRKEETEIRSSLLTAENAPIVYPLNMNMFIVIKPEKEKKGYTVTAIDQELGSPWSKTFSSDKGELTVEQVKTDMDRIFLLRRSKEDQKDVYSIQSLDGGSGTAIFTTDLRMGEDLAMPYFINNNFGITTTAGVFFRSADSKPGGLFFAKIDPSGRLEKYSSLPWETLKGQVKDNLFTEIAEGKRKILVEDVFLKPNNEGYTVVGETFKKSGTANEAVVSIMDYVLLQFNQQDILTRVDKIEQATKELTIKGPMAAEGEVALGTWLYKNKFFTYRNVLTGQRSYMIFQNDEQGKATAYFSATDTINKNDITSMNIEPREAVMNKDKKNKKDKEEKQEVEINKYTLNSASQKDVDAFVKAQTAKGILPLRDNRVLIYIYQNPKLSVNTAPATVR